VVFDLPFQEGPFGETKGEWLIEPGEVARLQEKNNQRARPYTRTPSPLVSPLVHPTLQKPPELFRAATQI
jgi:hypothetical protein